MVLQPVLSFSLIAAAAHAGPMSWSAFTAGFRPGQSGFFGKAAAAMANPYVRIAFDRVMEAAPLSFLEKMGPARQEEFVQQVIAERIAAAEAAAKRLGDGAAQEDIEPILRQLGDLVVIADLIADETRAAAVRTRYKEFRAKMEQALGRTIGDIVDQARRWGQDVQLPQTQVLGADAKPAFHQYSLKKPAKGPTEAEIIAANGAALNRAKEILTKDPHYTEDGGKEYGEQFLRKLVFIELGPEGRILRVEDDPQMKPSWPAGGRIVPATVLWSQGGRIEGALAGSEDDMDQRAREVLLTSIAKYNDGLVLVPPTGAFWRLPTKSPVKVSLKPGRAMDVRLGSGASTSRFALVHARRGEIKVIWESPSGIRTLPLNLTWILVGRSDEAALVFPDKIVSSKHLTLSAVGDVVIMADLSKNGSWIKKAD